MVGFYSSIIFIGIILIVVSIIWIMFDKKEAYDMELRMDEKKAELLNLIRDAEIMVEELNKFSDYIITVIEEKNSEMDSKFSEADKLINTIKNEMASFSNLQKEIEGDVNSIDIDPTLQEDNSIEKNETININSDEDLTASNSNSKDDSSPSKSNDKVVALNSKHNEVLMLAQKGFNETEIARKLNMGKGEIQLILGVNR